MVVGNDESTTTKNVGKLLAISIAMQTQRYDAGHIARWSTSGLHWKPLEAAIGQVTAPCRPGGCHGQRIR
jgi:hypothetical protein